MLEVYKNLYVGNDEDCRSLHHNFMVIHACKTCHKKELDYQGNLSSNHPNYLVYKTDSNLYLNMVDMPNEFLPKYTDPMIKETIDFINKHIYNKPILIHCNKGCSRSPSLALVYLAKIKALSNNSYEIAFNEFIEKYPKFDSGEGIKLYLENNWTKIMNDNF